MAALIDNKNKTLQKALADSLVDADRIDISTGFFYFSGLSLLTEELRNKPMRILIGYDLDPKRVAKMIQVCKDVDRDISRWRPDAPIKQHMQIERNYMEVLVALANDSIMLDDEANCRGFKLFVDKIRDGSLEIRQTVEDYHGKSYLVYKKQTSIEESPGVVFMGSSNFTYRGLVGQRELNDRFDDKDKFDEYKKDFEDNWHESRSVVIVNKYKKDEFIREVKSRVSQYHTPTPYEMYVKVLHELFARDNQQSIKTPSTITKRRFIDLKYQTDAIGDSIEKLKRYDGVIIADVVGLGKSIIASCVAKNWATPRDINTIIIAPPHLVPQWEYYKDQFRFSGSVFSLGKMQQLFDKYGQTDTPILIIVDEAHRHRNEETHSYKMLHKICRSHSDNKTILLTATPFNNSPQDVFALVKLFQTPGYATIRTAGSLSIRFRDLITEYKKIRSAIHQNNLDSKEIDRRTKDIAKETRSLVENVVIRRSRLDLQRIDEYSQDLKRQNIDFPEVIGPELIEYELGALSDIYVKTLEDISGDSNNDEGLTCAKYRPATYIRDKDWSKFVDAIKEQAGNDDSIHVENKILFKQQQRNLADLIRRLLVRRFESSKDAFRNTLYNMIESNREIKRLWEEDQKIPIIEVRKISDDIREREHDLEDGENSEDSSLINVSEFNKKDYYFISTKLLESSFIEDVDRDLRILQANYDKWFKNPDTESQDPKRDKLLKQIKELLKEQPDRKIIVFSSYADTINYLDNELKNQTEFRVLSYTSAAASAQSRKIIQDNFDASLPGNEQANDYDILLSTDAVSEGYNLHRAGIIINYDIPYNPTIVIQRIGRINRIGSKQFNEIKIFNSFPTATGEANIGIKRISTLKIKLFNEIAGSDTKTLTTEEELKSFLPEYIKNNEDQAEQLSYDAIHRDRYNKVKGTELVNKVQNIPRGSRILRKGRPESGVVVFGKKGDQVIFAFQSDNQSESQIINQEDALNYFEAEQSESSDGVKGQFWPVFRKVKKKLFEKPPLPSMKGRRQKVLEKLEGMKTSLPHYDTYYTDLISLIKEYDDVSEGTLMDIQRLTLKDLEKSHKELKALVPEQFIKNVAERVMKSEAGQELVLLVEELER